MLQDYLAYLLARPDSDLALASPLSPSAWRRYLEAMAEGAAPHELAERDGAGQLPAQDLARLAAAREQTLIDGLGGFTRDPEQLLALASALVRHMQAWREAATAAEQAAVAARAAKLDHDLRSPVGAILGAFDVLEASGVVPASHPMAAVIRNNAERLADLVEASGLAQDGEPLLDA